MKTDANTHMFQIALKGIISSNQSSPFEWGEGGKGNALPFSLFPSFDNIPELGQSVRANETVCTLVVTGEVGGWVDPVQ